MKVIKADLCTTAMACSVIALVSLSTGTFPFAMMLFLAAPAIALIGLGLSNLSQKLEKK